MSYQQDTGSLWARPRSPVECDELKSPRTTTARRHKHANYSCSSCKRGCTQGQPSSSRISSKAKTQQKPTPDAIQSSCFSSTSDEPTNDDKKCDAGGSKASKGVLQTLKTKGIQVYNRTVQAAEEKAQSKVLGGEFRWRLKNFVTK